MENLAEIWLHIKDRFSFMTELEIAHCSLHC